MGGIHAAVRPPLLVQFAKRRRDLRRVPQTEIQPQRPLLLQQVAEELPVETGPCWV